MTLGSTPAAAVFHKPPAVLPPPSALTSWLVATGLVIVVALLPLSDGLLGPKFAFAGQLPQIFVYALLSLGLTVITGFTGLLHLGVIAFMAIGVYAYAIATCPIYPFQIGFWPGLGLATVAGAGAGFLLGLPTMRLRGDYLAIVTLGFGEIVQDCLKNLEVVTKGTMGINPLPPPMLPGLGDLLGGTHTYRPTYYLYLALLLLAVAMVRNLKRARIGRAWLAVREDELAARAMGIGVAKQKLAAFAVAAALCATAGALFAALRGTSIEPGYYDFQNSVMVVASVIIGGLGSISGALLGALLIFGFNLIVLAKVADALGHHASTNVMADPKNWKCLLFGLLLVLMMRFRPQGLLPARETQKTREAR
jgi:branched-chain amino acid transport system permease protein